jgi:hypothetical protein
MDWEIRDHATRSGENFRGHIYALLEEKIQVDWKIALRAVKAGARVMPVGL